jgi:hypothetical protein
MRRGMRSLAERAAAEAAGKSLGARDADALDLAGLAIEHPHADVLERVRHDLGRARLEVVVAQHRNDRHRNGGQFVGQDVRFLGVAVVGEVAGQQQRIGRLGSLREEAAQRAGRILVHVDVAHDREAHAAGGLAHCCRFSWM